MIDTTTLDLSPLRPYPEGLIFMGWRGSVAHGTYVPPAEPTAIDDIDTIGVVIPGARYYFGLHEWGSRGTKEVRKLHCDAVFYELKKFVGMLLQGNPNVFTTLWLPRELWIESSNVWESLVEIRQAFVGKHVFNAFFGYAKSQLDKMELRDPAELRMYLALTAEAKHRGIHPNHRGQVLPYPEDYDHLSAEARVVNTTHDQRLLEQLVSYHRKGENIGYMGDKRKQLVLKHGYDSKNAAHLIRLLRMGIEFMRTGTLTVVRPDAEELLAIKRGEWSLERVKAASDAAFAKFKAEEQKSPLPDSPNYNIVEDWMVQTLCRQFR